jgi:hypothetical protein
MEERYIHWNAKQVNVTNHPAYLPHRVRRKTYSSQPGQVLLLKQGLRLT